MLMDTDVHFRTVSGRYYSDLTFQFSIILFSGLMLEMSVLEEVSVELCPNCNHSVRSYYSPIEKSSGSQVSSFLYLLRKFSICFRNLVSCSIKKKFFEIVFLEHYCHVCILLVLFEHSEFRRSGILRFSFPCLFGKFSV